MAYRRANDSGRALIEFLKATREDPKLLDAYYEQALIFREKGFHKLAVSRLEQALAIKPKYQKARLLLATLKLEQGKVTDAVEQLGESLGLSKTEATAIKPDKESVGEDRVAGIPPMILQSLHTSLPLPVVASQKKEDLVLQAAELPTEEEVIREERPASEARPVKRKKPVNRKKIRELIARKYKSKGHQRKQRSSWIAKLFSWPESFKPSQSQDTRIATVEEEDDLLPHASSNLKQEFRSTDTEPEDKPSRFESKKTLIAYNGAPEDTIDLLSDKVEREARMARAAKKMEEQNTLREKQLAELNAAKAAAEAIELAKAKQKEKEEAPRRIASRGLTFNNDAAQNDSEPAPRQPKKRSATTAKIVEDEWTKRLRFLAENGTSSLKAGEAFMFSEDTGEAVLFLANGQRIRRTIADPLDSQELMKMRRPDVLAPKELFFNTSLAGKMIAEPPPPAIPKEDPEPIVRQPRPAEKAAPPAPPSFKIEQIMENPAGFWNWAKRLGNL